MANYTLKQMERPFDENLSLMTMLDLCSEESSYQPLRLFSSSQEMMIKKTMYQEMILPLKSKLQKHATHLGDPQKNDVQFMDSLLEKLNKWVENLPQICLHLLLYAPLQSQVSNRAASNYQNSYLGSEAEGNKTKKVIDP